MKPKARQGKKKGGKFNSDDKLTRYMTSVKDYVESKGGATETGHGQRFNFVMKKSRKEVRKEKRKMKKAKMRDSHMRNSLSTDANKVQLGKSNTLSLEKKQDKGMKGESKKATERTKLSRNVGQNKANNETEEVHVDSKDIMAKERKMYEFQLNESNKQALIDANVDEDKEIKRLEKLLGFNKRRNKKTLPQSFSVDGLDYILGALDSGAAGMDDSDDEAGVAKAKDNLENLEDSESELSGDKDDEDESLDDDIQEEEDDHDDIQEDDDGEEEEDDDEEEGEVERMETIEEEDEEEEEENEEEMEEEDDPDESQEKSDGGIEEHLTPEEQSTSDESNKPTTLSSAKYIPPHLRCAMDSKRKVELEKLKKNVKGLVNRLSEANLASISGQLEELYMSCSRKDMNDTLTDILLAACVTPALMPDRLLMEHVLLVSVLHYTVGLEVGAQFLETVVRKFDELYKLPREGKECDNLVAMVAHLYHFQVVHPLLIFDILKKLVGAFSEKDIELVLFVLKTVGFALRKDDPLALKELISEAQHKASDAGTKFKDQTRVRFMLETMMALKNNDMRKIPGYDPEPVEKLRKLQKTLIHRTASGSDLKLRVSLENLLEADQVGRWWIVGSSWSGAPMIGGQSSKTSQQTTSGQFSSKVLELARKQRMNTDIRRNIFCVIMTSEDYLDAFEKLLRLGLKDQQEREIVHVLMDCCLQEKAFNAFYAVLGEKLCSHDRRFQATTPTLFFSSHLHCDI
ncbi:nucleolar MIF4G domain-containing protein 1 isoform X2 [Clupea harengus]|uniref:Nucleolar MIF4G domain-containing protein 1 n=1 Tax=Clupea harengus TaxID=7950 RepID=A0A8M1KKT2_CLUHA|nr:nucleolar MIF4G domain-containing protein 1 isoform X2 [Clupea harengus]